MKSWRLHDFGLERLTLDEVPTPTPSRDEVLELTRGDGVNQALEVVGGKSINQSIKEAKVGGLITIIGFLDNPEATISLMPMLFRQSRLQAITVGHRKVFEAMNAFLEQKRIRPVIDRVYAFEEAHAAFAHLNKGAFGKVVIKTS